MSPRFEAALFWQFIQRHSTPGPRFGAFRTPNSDFSETVRIETETPVRIAAEISVRIDFGIGVRITPKSLSD
jgi:hypothetical protein